MQVESYKNRRLVHSWVFCWMDVLLESKLYLHKGKHKIHSTQQATKIYDKKIHVFMVAIRANGFRISFELVTPLTWLLNTNLLNDKLTMYPRSKMSRVEGMWRSWGFESMHRPS